MGLWPGASSALWLSLTALVIVVTEEDMVWILAAEVAQLSELLFAEAHAVVLSLTHPCQGAAADPRKGLAGQHGFVGNHVLPED